MLLLSAVSGPKNPATEAHEENIGQYIIHHVQNSNEWNIFGIHVQLPQFEPFYIWGMQIDLSITNHVVMIWIAALLLLLLFGLSFRRRKLVPTGFAAILEMLVIFIRDEIVIANLGEKDGRKFTPLIGTFFFFILTCNSAAMAIVTLVSGQVFGIKNNGLIGHFKALVPSGVPVFLIPLMFIIELMGLIAKHFALIIRLFANMIAGHIVFFAFLGLIMIFKSVWISPLSVGFAVFVDLLEILVAFIQAYVFTILSTLFIGMAIHPEH